MKAINDRLQSKETKGRPALDGWIEKNGRFEIAMSSAVYGRFSRKTRLRAVAEKDGKLTVIRGFVPNGLSREGLAIVFVALVAFGIVLIAQGNAFFAIILAVLGVFLSVPLVGDYQNHDVLLGELEKTLKAKPTPPKV
jgi:hypothetical protein